MKAYKVAVFFVEKENSPNTVPGDPSGIEQLEMLYRSCVLFNPDAELVILTSPDTDLSRLSVHYERFDRMVDCNSLMFERTRLQSEYITHSNLEMPIAFLDSDMLVTRDLSEVYLEDFDVGLTYRKDRRSGRANFFL